MAIARGGAGEAFDAVPVYPPCRVVGIVTRTDLTDTLARRRLKPDLLSDIDDGGSGKD